MIRFEIFQALSFVLSASMFFYLTVKLCVWFISGLIGTRPKWR